MTDLRKKAIDFFSKRIEDLFEQGGIGKATILDAWHKSIDLYELESNSKHDTKRNFSDSQVELNPMFAKIIDTVITKQTKPKRKRF